ncbi:hybrid sensor histidine kinase/response regulator [Pseudohongiella acticola]|nr:ATP-binding protein [Pseudohongiella acticola]
MTRDSLLQMLRLLLLLPENRDAGLLQWRISILRSIQLATLTLGALTMIAHTQFPIPDQTLILVADALALVCLAALTFAPQLSHQIRAWLFLFLIYFFWFWMFSQVDVVSIIYLLSVPVFAAMLVSLRAGIIMLTLACIGLFVMGLTYSPDIVIGAAEAMSPLQTWSMMVVNFAFCASLLTLACGVLINRLELALALRRQAEERSRELTQHMQQMEKLQAVGTLASGVAHDFNNILTIIMSLTEAVKDQHPAPAATKQLDQVLLASERGRDIVRQMLMFSRQSLSGRELIDLNNVLTQMEPLLRAQLPAGARLQVCIEDASTPCWINANASEIQQVLMNLTSNAVLALTPDRQAAADAQITISVAALNPDDALLTKLSLDSNKSYASVTVHDNGVGIPPAVISRLFEPFFTTREPGEGTGLGLASSHGIISALGGGINVTSEVGIGSDFRFVLPLAAPTDVVTETDAASPTTTSPRPIDQLPILLVDDEPLILGTARAILEHMGYPVTAVSSAADARAALAEQEFALVITDFSMPGENGVSLIRHARALQPDIPVILVSGLGQIDELDDDTAANRLVMLPKPYKKQDLLNAIERLL